VVEEKRSLEHKIAERSPEAERLEETGGCVVIIRF
jgi:hypothetical protein